MPTGRKALRQRLLQQREAFFAGPSRSQAEGALAGHLVTVLSALEPDILGLYWPHRSEFNAVAVVTADPLLAKLAAALPFAQRAPVQMHYRAWNGAPPSAVDDCGIPASTGAPVVPDVVLVPCVGFTASGYRLGYGGGYFDRWMAAHPGVTAIGVAWAHAEIDEATLQPEAHDQTLTLIITECGAG